MKSFSERFGFKAVSKELQINSLSIELRNSLWNVLYETFLGDYIQDNLPYSSRYKNKDIEHFFQQFWRDNLKNTTDSFLDEFEELLSYGRAAAIVKKFRAMYFEEFQWNEVYDFLESLLRFFDCPILEQQINHVLQRELSAWRFVGGYFTQITSEQEMELLEESINDDKYISVSRHLEQALVLMSDKKNPDYRNSIKESISAVEGMARIITNNSKASLGQALGKIEGDGKLHGSLKASFSSLYGYTSDEGGIRHSMLEEPNLTIDDAKFFLLSCTSFVNYLKAKI